LLPTGAEIIAAHATNNGTAVTQAGGTLEFGPEVWAATPAGDGTIGTTVTAASINGGGGVTFGETKAALGSAGAAVGGLTAVAANTGVTVSALVAAVTTGDLAVQITYLI
jgi:hypothetical protein